jgi:hypothetical protein
VGEQVVQCQITTPLEGYGEKAAKGKPATFKIGEFDVVVKQDVQKAKGMAAGKAETEISIKYNVKYKARKGKIAQITDSSKITAEVQTRYGPGTSPEMPSTYGKGTTPEDIQAGTTTLGYHEGGHGVDYFQYMQANPPPKFEGKVGMTVQEYQKAWQKFDQDMKAYTKKIEAYTRQQTDCVGVKATLFCPADEGTREEEEEPAQPKIQRLLSSRAVQAKLTVNPPDDQYEREADRVAATLTQTSDSQIQRQPKEEEDAEKVQAKGAGSPVPKVSTDLEARINAARGSGQPLPNPLRGSFEPHFGRDFSGVRIHSDAEANILSGELQARAFTTGQDVFFAEGAYKPDSETGRGLISHEIAHVVQQGAAPVFRPPDMPVFESNDTLQQLTQESSHQFLHLRVQMKEKGTPTKGSVDTQKTREEEVPEWAVAQIPLDIDAGVQEEAKTLLGALYRRRQLGPLREHQKIEWGSLQVGGSALPKPDITQLERAATARVFVLRSGKWIMWIGRSEFLHAHPQITIFNYYSEAPRHYFDQFGEKAEDMAKFYQQRNKELKVLIEEKKMNPLDAKSYLGTLHTETLKKAFSGGLGGL